MLKRVLVPALIVSLAGLAWAEPEKNTPKKDKPAVPATPIVKPKDASQPAEKAKKPEPTLVVGSKAPAITPDVGATTTAAATQAAENAARVK